MMEKELPLFDRAIEEIQQLSRCYNKGDFFLATVKIESAIQQAMERAADYPDNGAYRRFFGKDIVERTKDVEFRLEILFNNVAEFLGVTSHEQRLDLLRGDYTSNNPRQYAYDYFTILLRPNFWSPIREPPRDPMKRTLFFLVKEIQKKEGLIPSGYLETNFG